MHFEDELDELRFSLIIKALLMDKSSDDSIRDFNQLLQKYHNTKSFIKPDKKFDRSAEDILKVFKNKKITIPTKDKKKTK